MSGNLKTIEVAEVLVVGMMKSFVLLLCCSAYILLPAVKLVPAIAREVPWIAETGAIEVIVGAREFTARVTVLVLLLTETW